LVIAREGELQSIEHLRSLYLVYLSQPRADRTVYQAIRRGPSQTILELGMGNGQRAVRMIALATSQTGSARVSYTGVDPFEACDTPVLNLKAAYQQLRPTGVKLKLVPGMPMAVLPQVANGLGQFDLVVISVDALTGQTPRAWFYLQRLLLPTSLVLLEEPADGGQTAFRPLQVAEIEARSLTNRTRKAA
jgi:hypothetical protein